MALKLRKIENKDFREGQENQSKKSLFQWSDWKQNISLCSFFSTFWAEVRRGSSEIIGFQM